MNNERVAEKAFEDFPEELVPDGNWDPLYQKNSVDFPPCGVDADGRLIVAADDGAVFAYDLATAHPDQDPRGNWHLHAEWEIISQQSDPAEYMLDRDTSDWLWVHPQWRYLTAESGSADFETKYEPIQCKECGERVVLARNPPAEHADEAVKFECACSVGSIGAVKPDSWTGDRFL